MSTPPKPALLPSPSRTSAYTASQGQIWAWALGGIANHALICAYGQASAIFTIGFGLNAALVSWAIMLPRLIDGITDPILGHISDNTHTRWGRRRPFLIVGSVLGSASLVALWWADPAWSATAQLAYLFGIGTLFYCSWGLYSMAWTAIGYELTDDYHERSRIAAIGSIFLSIVLLANYGTYWLALRPIFQHGVLATAQELVGAGFDWSKVSSILSDAFFNKPGAVTNEINGIRWISAMVGIAAVSAGITSALFCKERYTKPNPSKKAHVPLLLAIRQTMSNKPFFVLILVKLCQTLGERAAGGIMFFVSIYYVCSGNKDLAMLINFIGGVIGVVWGLLMVPLVKPISCWIGKKGAFCLCTGVSFVASVITPFALTPDNPYLMLLPALIGFSVASLGNTISNAIMPDICDYDEYERGQRREGLFTAAMGFMSKIEISLCALLVGYLVVWSGLDTKATVQAPGVLNHLYWLAILPSIFFSGITFLLALSFPMTEASMAEIRRKLDERHRNHPETAPAPEGSATTPALALVPSPTVSGPTTAGQG